MAFCMDNSSCAEHIVCMLRDSICGSVPYLKEYQQPIEGSNERDVPCEATVILARVYVVNDLLYNADNGVTTPYRALLQVLIYGSYIVDGTTNNLRGTKSVEEPL